LRLCVCLSWFKETRGLHNVRRSRVPTSLVRIKSCEILWTATQFHWTLPHFWLYSCTQIGDETGIMWSNLDSNTRWLQGNILKTLATVSESIFLTKYITAIPPTPSIWASNIIVIPKVRKIQGEGGPKTEWRQGDFIDFSNISHIQSLLVYCVPCPTHKHENCDYTSGRLLIANHLDQSFYMVNQELVLNYVMPFANHKIICTKLYISKRTRTQKKWIQS
jgi:hypothetical protein